MIDDKNIILLDSELFVDKSKLVDVTVGKTLESKRCGKIARS